MSELELEDVGWAPAAGVEAAVFESEAVLYDESSNAILRINGTAVEVWQRCDGHLPLGRVIDDLERAYTASREEVAEGVMDLVADLAERGFLARSSGDAT